MLSCFRSRLSNFKRPYQDLSQQFEEGDIVYGLSIDRTPGVDALDIKKFPKSIDGKANILTQNQLTDAVFGASVTPRNYRSDEEIIEKLFDPLRGLCFKRYTTDYPPLNKVDYIDMTGEQRANKIWKRTSKAGLIFQIFERDKKVHFCVDHISNAIYKIANKEGIEGNCVTASEIRYLFRHRHEAQVLKNLKIYNKNEEIPINIFFSHPSWDSYIPKKYF